MTFEFRKVVVDIPNPNAAEQPTLAAAVEIAGHGRIRLCLFHSVCHGDLKQRPGLENIATGEARTLLLESRRVQLQQLADSTQTQQLEVSIELVWAQDPFLELVRVVGEQEIDLLISKPRTRWERHLRNQSWQLIRYCPSSLLLVKPGQRKRYTRVLAAIDPLHADDKPASLDRRILEAAHSMGELYGANLEVINVVVPVLSAASMMTAPLLAADAIAQDTVIEAHRVQAWSLAQKHVLSEANINIIVGEPAVQIVEFAADHACDLLVMGAVSRSALGRVLIGNTAERVLDAVASDLLIIKPGGGKRGNRGQ